ncbi:MAG: discoidin domain-containing protein [bacterium]
MTEDGVGIEVSSAPNPAWTAEKLLDGGFGPADGWLALTEGEPPWFSITFPNPKPFSGLIFYQVSFAEAGGGRYSRPKKLLVEFDGGKPWTVVLHDLEGKPQVWKFLPGSVSTFKVTIDKIYSDARYPKYTGFQEIIFLEDGDAEPPGAAMVKSAVPPPEEPPLVKKPGVGDTSLEEDEKELLKLLEEFYDKFRRYLLKRAK